MRPTQPERFRPPWAHPSFAAPRTPGSLRIAGGLRAAGSPLSVGRKRPGRTALRAFPLPDDVRDPRERGNGRGKAERRDGKHRHVPQLLR